MTAQQIRELAIQRLAGNVVFLQDVPRDLAAEVFAPLALMDEEARAELSRKLESGECVDLYQFTDKAMPRRRKRVADLSELPDDLVGRYDNASS